MSKATDLALKRLTKALTYLEPHLAEGNVPVGADLADELIRDVMDQFEGFCHPDFSLKDRDE